MSLRTLQRWKRFGVRDHRKGSVKRIVRKLSEECCQEIVGQCNSERFQDLNPHEIVPLLLNEGVYLASVSTFYRVLKTENLLHHRSNTKARNGCGKPPERLATGSDQVYCWDITWLPRTVKGFFFYAYVVIDIFDKTIVGWAVHEEESERYSRDLFERTLQGRKIALRALHADNGHPMKGISLIALLTSLNVEISHNRPRVSNDNPFIESFFKTLKYRVDYPLRFRDLIHAREWMASFVNWYNTEHLHSAIGHVTPHQLRTGEAVSIFERRNQTMQRAREAYPERWGSRLAKHWTSPQKVVLNPDKER
jgi:transposase InsO family protein